MGAQSTPTHCSNVFGKAKSISLPCVLWHPIATISQPFISRRTLHIAAQAFTCFLRCLVEEIIASIRVLRMSDIAPWVNELSNWGVTCTGEADCKEQFGWIKPATTVQAATAGRFPVLVSEKTVGRSKHHPECAS